MGIIAAESLIKLVTRLRRIKITPYQNNNENYNEKINSVSVVIVQPNIDPYNEKFSGNQKEQIEKTFSNTNYVKNILLK